MDSLANSMDIAASGMRANAKRIRHISENIANADTPGYKRKLISFKQITNSESGRGLVAAGSVRLDQSAPRMIFDPSHPLAKEDGTYMGSNVNMIVEVADSREAQRSYEANLKIFDQARKMSSSTLELLRR